MLGELEAACRCVAIVKVDELKASQCARDLATLAPSSSIGVKVHK